MWEWELVMPGDLPASGGKHSYSLEWSGCGSGSGRRERPVTVHWDWLVGAALRNVAHEGTERFEVHLAGVSEGCGESHGESGEIGGHGFTS